MIAAWLSGDVMALDLETTGPDPETARIVTCAAIRCGAAGAQPLGHWLVNPGCPIPPEATAVHHITDDIAATGWTTKEAMRAIYGVISREGIHGLPLVIMNASFDLTVLMNEAQRNDVGFGFGAILDPRVIDLACDRYRKGKRKLTDLAAHYKVKLGEAHTADGDALTAARIVWAQAKHYPLIAAFTLEQMQTFQAEAYREWAEHLAEYYASQGKHEVIDRSWPIRKPQHKEAA